MNAYVIIFLLFLQSTLLSQDNDVVADDATRACVDTFVSIQGRALPNAVPRFVGICGNLLKNSPVFIRPLRKLVA